MNEQCHYRDTCKMYAFFHRAGDTLYRTQFCEGNYAACERYKLLVANQTVPQNLMPEGTKLWPDGEQPPIEFRM